MTTIAPMTGDAALPMPASASPRLAEALAVLSRIWLLVLPALRPIAWSGEVSGAADMAMLAILAAAAATGLLHRAVERMAPPTGRGFALGVAFLALAASGAWRADDGLRAWALWTQWTLHALAAWALLPAIVRWPGHLLAGLAAGALLEGVLLAGQFWWEKPALRAAFAADPALVEDERLRGQYEARLASWRLTGSFLLANTLASWAILVLPPLAAAAWCAWRARTAARWALALAAGAALAALAGSGSKAGILALLVALAIVAVPRLALRARLAAVVAMSAIGVVAVAVPALREGIVASARVRIEYWHGAAALVAEQPLVGHGLEGFAAGFPRVKPPAAEETIYAHSELLQAAVDLGLPAALILLGWAAVMVGRRPPAEPAAGVSTSVGAVGWPAILAAASVVGYAVAVGDLLGERLRCWPGGQTFEAALGAWTPRVQGFGAAVACAIALATLRAAAAAPPAALRLGVLACLLHALVDFHLHSAQVVGVLACCVAGLASARAPAARTLRPFAAIGCGLLASAVCVLAMLAGGISDPAARDDARAAAQSLRRARIAAARRDREQAEIAEIEMRHALARFGIGAPPNDARRALALAALPRTVDAALDWPRDLELAQAACAIAEHAAAADPVLAVRLAPELERLAAAFPRQVACVAAVANIHTVAARAGEGAAVAAHAAAARLWWERAVAAYPVHLPFRRALAKAAERLGDAAAADAQRKRIAELEPAVHPLNR